MSLESIATALTASQPPGAVLAVRAFPNFIPGASLKGEIPEGLQVILAIDTPVDGTLLPKALFQTLGVAQCTKPPQKPMDLHSAVGQNPTQRYASDVYSAKQNCETREWASELGGPGAFVGLYTHHDQAKQQADASYFLAARASPATYVDEFVQRIKDTPTLTYRQLLLTDPKWRARVELGKSVSERNVRRILANAAEVADVSVARYDDLAALVSNPDYAPPELAQGDRVVPTYSIRSLVYQGQEAAMISYGVVPAEDCLRGTHSAHYVAGNAADGLAVFPELNELSILEAGGLPATTGIDQNASSSSSSPPKIGSGIVWEGSAPHASASGHRSLHAPDFKAGFSGLGWNAARHHMSTLVPVAVKIGGQE